MKRTDPEPKSGDAKAVAKRQRPGDPPGKEETSPDAPLSKAARKVNRKEEEEEEEQGEKKVPYQDLLKGKNRHRLPDKIMRCLIQGIEPDVLWWSPHENGFAVDADRVQEKLLDVHFRCTKLSSLVRSLNRWGFRRDFYRTLPKNALAFMHPEFKKDAPHLLKDMKIIPSTTQDLPDSSDTDEGSDDDEKERTSALRRQAAAISTESVIPGRALLLPPQSMQSFLNRAPPTAQSLFLSDASRLPQSFLQSHQHRQASALGQSFPSDLVASQLQQPRQITELILHQAGTDASSLGQTFLPTSHPFFHGAQQTGHHKSFLTSSHFLSDIAPAAAFRVLQLRQQQQHSSRAMDSYLQTLGAAGGFPEAQLLGTQDEHALQARLLCVSNQSNVDTLRLVQLAEQYRQGDQNSVQRTESSFTQPVGQQQQQAAQLSQGQYLVNTVLERQQVNSQIQHLLQEIQRRQNEESEDNCNGPPTDS